MADGFFGATVFFRMFVLFVVVRGLSIQKDFVGPVLCEVCSLVVCCVKTNFDVCLVGYP